MSGGQSHTAYRLNLRLLRRFTPRNDNVVGVCGIIIGHEILITIMKMASGPPPLAGQASPNCHNEDLIN